jgi:hypothetical protein
MAGMAWRAANATTPLSVRCQQCPASDQQGPGAAPDDRRECAVELIFAANRRDDELLSERLRGQLNVPSLDASLKRVGPNQHRDGSGGDELAQHLQPLGS